MHINDIPPQKDSPTDFSSDLPVTPGLLVLEPVPKRESGGRRRVKKHVVLADVHQPFWKVLCVNSRRKRRLKSSCKPAMDSTW